MCVYRYIYIYINTSSIYTLHLDNNICHIRVRLGISGIWGPGVMGVTILMGVVLKQLDG